MRKRGVILAIMLSVILGCSNQKEQSIQAESAETPALNLPPDYSKVRIKRFPLAVQCWTFRKFTFFETLDKVRELGINYIEAYPGQKLGIEGSDARFHHDMTEEQISLVKRKLEERDIRLVAYGVVNFDNDKESARKVFDFAQKMEIRTIVTEPKYDDFSIIEKLAKEYHTNVAVHNHPPPSKYAKPETVLEHVKGLNERLGSCADTGHWLRTGIAPVEGLKMLRGRIKDVHLKDLNELGNKEAYDVPFGQGAANIRDVLAELTLQNYQGYLTIEYEKEEDAMNPLPPIAEGIEYIKSVTYYWDYEALISSWDGRYNKHGWNHYGPGYFSLDEKTGVLTAHGGMGLFWYAKKKLGDFVLELEFRFEKKKNNSGIFYRIPEIPINNDYVYHSFEVQIDGGSGDKHMTGAIYDAIAPTHYAALEPGEWNHYKIEVVSSHISIILNGDKVVDWDMEPRGKVKDIAPEGYIGLQNHDDGSPVEFRNIYVREL